MKSNKGITLTSLIIYIIGMTIIVATISTLTLYFYKNIRIGDINSNIIQYTKFSSIFLEDTNKKSNSIIDCKTTGSGSDKISYIIFSNRKSIYVYGRK